MFEVRTNVEYKVNPQGTDTKTRYKRLQWQRVAAALRSPVERRGSMGADQFVTLLPVLLRPCYLSKLINPLQTRRCYDVTTCTPPRPPSPGLSLAHRNLDFGELVAAASSGRLIGQRVCVRRPPSCESISACSASGTMHRRSSIRTAGQIPTGCGARSTAHKSGSHFCTFSAPFCTFFRQTFLSSLANQPLTQKTAPSTLTLITDYRLPITDY